jgi:hypothetical protein
VRRSRASGWSLLTTLWGFPCCVSFPCVHPVATRTGRAYSSLCFTQPSGADALDLNQIKAYLSHGVGRYCNVRIYRTIGKSGLTFVGFKSDTDGARWLLDHLADFVRNSLFEHLLDHDLLAPRTETLGFVYGCTGRITATLIAACEQSKTERTTSGKELVIIKDHAIKDFMKAEGYRP